MAASILGSINVAQISFACFILRSVQTSKRLARIFLFIFASFCSLKTHVLIFCSDYVHLKAAMKVQYFCSTKISGFIVCSSIFFFNIMRQISQCERTFRIRSSICSTKNRKSFKLGKFFNKF